ncbi:hypothetical protein [Lacinutrix undariae]
MKKIFLTFALLFTITTVFTSCRDQKKTPQEKVEDTVDDAGDAIEDAADDVEDAVDDAADDVEDAVD